MKSLKVSIICWLLATNDIEKKIPQPVQRRFFADNLNVSVPTADLHLAQSLI